MRTTVKILLLISLCTSIAYAASNKKETIGIDVSHRQGSIDWNAVKQDPQNIQFAYIKATEGATFVDDNFSYNVRKAHESGLLVGAYHFFRMTSSPEDQFNSFRKQLNTNKHYISLIPVIDVETFDNKTSAEVKKAVETFVDLIYNEYKVYPIIYGPDIAPKRMLSDKVNKHCMFFLGQPGSIEPIQKHDIWQYSYSGKINGIKTDVDLCKLCPLISIKDMILQ